MKLIKPYFEILEQKPRTIIIPADMEIGPKMARQELINTIYRQIEIAGRTCYKSEDRITENSAKEFVDRMIKSGHGAMLEHGTVYLHQHQTYHYDGMYGDDKYPDREFLSKYAQNKYSKYIRIGDEHYATTNFRILVENDWLDDLQYISEPTEYHEKRICVRFICDRGVSHEFVRHRVFSFAQESTRRETMAA